MSKLQKLPTCLQNYNCPLQTNGRSQIRKKIMKYQNCLNKFTKEKKQRKIKIAKILTFNNEISPIYFAKRICSDGMLLSPTKFRRLKYYIFHDKAEQ